MDITIKICFTIWHSDWSYNGHVLFIWVVYLCNYGFYFFSIFSKIGSYINNYPLKSKKLWTNVFLPCLLLVGELLVGPSEWAWFSSSVVQQQSWVLPISPFSMWHIDARIWLETEKVAACFCSMAWSIFFLFGPENHSSNSRKVVRLSGSCKGVIVVLKGKTVSSKTTSQETKTLLVYGCKHLYPLCNELYLMKTQGKVFLEIFFFMVLEIRETLTTKYFLVIRMLSK